MAKGIIYVCSTAIPGLIKIGKAGTDNFEQRMRKLEKDGYNNANALKREFAIEVDNYDEKEKLLDAVLSKIQVGGTTSELFALDIELAKQLLSSLQGTPVYPVGVTSEEVFEEATEAVNSSLLPNGIYTLEVNSQGVNHTCKGTLEVTNGSMKLKKGSVLSIDVTRNGITKGWLNLRDSLKIDENHVLQEDVPCKSVSQAAFLVIGTSNNGWVKWLDSEGNFIQRYKPVDNDEED